jgi:hypothetical protein
MANKLMEVREMKNYKFEIMVRENGKEGLQNPWKTTDWAEGESEQEALINLDMQNDKLGYKVVQAKIIEVREVID